MGGSPWPSVTSTSPGRSAAISTNVRRIRRATVSYQAPRARQHRPAVPHRLRERAPQVEREVRVAVVGEAAGEPVWETHPGDELIHILDGTAILEIVCDDGPPKSFALRAGMMAVIPQGAWHRFHSSEGTTLMTATPFPGEKIDLDVDDPRMVERTST